MKKKLIFSIIAFVLIAVALVGTTYAYVGTIYKSNNETVEIGELDNITVELFILDQDGFKLIPFNAIPTRENEVNEITVKIVVSSEIAILYKLKHNVPSGYEVVDFRDWSVYEITTQPNEHTFKIRLLENLNGTTLNFNFEVYDIVVK